MFARYGAIKSLRCIRDTTARTTKRVQVTYATRRLLSSRDRPPAKPSPSSRPLS